MGLPCKRRHPRRAGGVPDLFETPPPAWPVLASSASHAGEALSQKSGMASAMCSTKMGCAAAHGGKPHLAPQLGADEDLKRRAARGERAGGEAHEVMRRSSAAKKAGGAPSEKACAQAREDAKGAVTNRSAGKSARRTSKQESRASSRTACPGVASGVNSPVAMLSLPSPAASMSKSSR